MPFLKGYVEIEFYKGQPLEQGSELLAPWVRERHTAYADLYGEPQHTVSVQARTDLREGTGRSEGAGNPWSAATQASVT